MIEVIGYIALAFAVLYVIAWLGMRWLFRQQRYK